MYCLLLMARRVQTSLRVSERLLSIPFSVPIILQVVHHSEFMQGLGGVWVSTVCFAKPIFILTSFHSIAKQYLCWSQGNKRAGAIAYWYLLSNTRKVNKNQLQFWKVYTLHFAIYCAARYFNCERPKRIYGIFCWMLFFTCLRDRAKLHVLIWSAPTNLSIKWFSSLILDGNRVNN